jgi:hypothetical protein
VEHIQQRDGRWLIADFHQQEETDPHRAYPWLVQSGDRSLDRRSRDHGAKAVRAMDKAGRLTGETLFTQAVYLVVRERAKNIGLELAPDDVRRTCLRRDAIWTFCRLKRRGVRLFGG